MFLPIEPIQQDFSHDCGASCIDMLCDFWGLNRPDIKVSKNGMTQSDIINILRHCKMKVSRRIYLSEMSVSYAVNRQRAVLAYDNKREHWVIVSGLVQDPDGNYYYMVCDPAVGGYLMIDTWTMSLSKVAFEVWPRSIPWN